MPPSSSSSSPSSQSWSDPHGLQRRWPYQLSPLPRTSSGSGVHSGGEIGDVGEGREARDSVGENVRVARGLLGNEDGEFSSTVVTTAKLSEASSSSAVNPSSADRPRPERGPSWRRSLTPPVSPWPIRHWWAQG